jgi:uncharacterized membrane protein
MRGIIRFLKSTVLGGLVVLLPLVALVAILIWAANLAIDSIRPLLQWLPDKSVGGVSLILLVAILALVGVSFLAGLLAETAIVRGLGVRAERLAMFIPGYALMKSVGADFVGIEGKRPVQTVLARFEASFQLGFLMETLADGRLVVFVPGVPRAFVGALHILTADRVQPLDISISTTLDVLGRLGVGLKDTRPFANLDLPAPRA